MDTASLSVTNPKQHPPFVVGIDLGTTNSLMAIAGWEERYPLLPGPSGAEQGESSLSQYIPVQVLQLPQMNLDGTVTEHVLFPSVVFQESPDAPRFVGMGAREAKFQRNKGHTVFYSVKMDLGTDDDFYYPAAVTPDLNTPVKVSAAILKAMRTAAEDKLHCSLSDVPVIVTVPASFGPPQRRDTVMAAQIAGLAVSENCLFDEPNAALLAYMNRRRVQGRWNQEETVLVFDFGGGTCDIAIIEVSFSPVSKKIHLRNLALSRFEQLGGDDLDKCLVHTYLKEKFYLTAGRKERDITRGERQLVWGQLGKVAESLKIRLCEEVSKVYHAHGQWDETDLMKVRVSLMPQAVRTTQGAVEMRDLVLDFTAFARAMAPFLKPDGSDNADKEFYRITSIFTPIQNALSKANLKSQDITRVLLVGGSSRNPFVVHAIQEYFDGAALDRVSDLDVLVAEGAALQSYWQFIVGHDLLAPIVGDTIGLLTEGEGFVPLISVGSPIPFPPDAQWVTYRQFRVPRDLMSHVDLVICAGSATRPVHTIKLIFDKIILRNTPVHLRIRMDGNKVFHLEAFLPDYPDVRVAESLGNPLNLLPMTPVEKRRAELVKALKRARPYLDQHTDKMVELAELENRLGYHETALEWVNEASRREGGQPRAEVRRIKAMAFYGLGERGEAHRIWADLANQNPMDANAAHNASISASDLPTREKYARQAVAARPGDGNMLSLLAWVLEAKGDHAQARQTFESARQQLEDAVRYSPHSREHWDSLAMVYDHLELFVEAEDARRRRDEVPQGEALVDTGNLIALTNVLVKA